MKNSLSLLIFILSLSSCGIKGPPLPPLNNDIMQKQKAESVTVNTNQEPPRVVSGDSSSASQFKKKSKQSR